MEESSGPASLEADSTEFDPLDDPEDNGNGYWVSLEQWQDLSDQTSNSSPNSFPVPNAEDWKDDNDNDASIVTVSSKAAQPSRALTYDDDDYNDDFCFSQQV